jgi:hypothetical protein
MEQLVIRRKNLSRRKRMIVVLISILMPLLYGAFTSFGFALPGWGVLIIGPIGLIIGVHIGRNVEYYTIDDPRLTI